MADYSEFAEPIRVRSWQRYVEDDGDLHTLLHEATGTPSRCATPSRPATTGSIPATEPSTSSTS